MKNFFLGNKIKSLVRKRSAKAAIRRLNILRSAPFEKLSDPDFLEETIAKLGIYPDDEGSLDALPEFLWPHYNQGFKIWQYPNQLSRFLIEMTKYKIQAYLEIGVAYGGSLITIVEYLKKFNPGIQGIGIDPEPVSELLREYKRKNDSVKYIQDFSHRLMEYIDFRSAFFDLVFIDSDHDARWNDFQLIKDRSKIIAFQDIVHDRLPDDGRVWERIKATYKNEYEFKEFIDQYEEVVQRTGMRFNGIGLAIKKNE